MKLSVKALGWNPKKQNIANKNLIFYSTVNFLHGSSDVTCFY